MLEVRNLFKALNGNEILKNINLRFETGVYGLLGANGAGKTTLIKCLCNLYEIDSGSILYNGIQINHLKNNYFNSFRIFATKFWLLSRFHSLCFYLI